MHDPVGIGFHLRRHAFFQSLVLELYQHASLARVTLEERQQSGEQRAKIREYWKQRLLVLLETQLLARTLGGDGQRALESLASEVAERKKNPYTAVRELMARAGL